MKRRTDKRLVDELPDVGGPPPGYGQRQLAVINKLFQPEMPDGELINLYFLVHDWHDESTETFGAWFKQIETVLLGRMSKRNPKEGDVRSLLGFDPEDFREATETACSGMLTDWQILELTAIAMANRGCNEIGHRWEAVMDVCRAQILRRIKTTRSNLTSPPDDEMPYMGCTPAEIEARHHANEVYGSRIKDWRQRLKMHVSSLGDALCLPEREIGQAEDGNPPHDPRIMLVPLILADDYYPPDERVFHTTSTTYVAHFYEAARRMTTKAREIWLLHHADGLTVARIAERQNLSTSMIAQRLREAEREIERYGPQPPKPSKRRCYGPKP